MIKLKNIRWGDHLGLSGPNMITWILIRRRQEGQSTEECERFEDARVLAGRTEEEAINQGIRVPSRGWIKQYSR